jgi:hypothetical protein
MEREPETIFLQWLGTVIRDEQWRTAIRAQMQQYDLPVIDAGENYSLQTQVGTVR